MTRYRTSLAWRDTDPIRSDLFGTERLEHHAETLAAAQRVTVRPARVPSLSRRLQDNVRVLLSAYHASAAAVQRGQTATPAAEWLLDNFHLVELQLHQIKEDLPPGFYRQLPKLADGHLAGYPRVIYIAWAYVAHTDSLISGQVLRRFVAAYQRVTPLTIGELWAVAITLRIVLVENMRRVAMQIVDAQEVRAAADRLVDDVTGPTAMPIHQAVADFDAGPLNDTFAAQMALRLRGFDPADTPLFGWLEERLRHEGTTVDEVVDRVLHRQGATNVTMRNIVTSMRIIAEIDWADFFEDVSLVDARLRASSDFAAMDFATRNAYRTAIEDLARGSSADELAVTDAVLLAAAEGKSSRERDPGHALIGGGRAALEAALGYRPPLGRRLPRMVSALGLAGYLSALGVMVVLIVWAALTVTGVIGWALVPLGLLAFLPASEAATSLVNDLITHSIPPRPLPGMDLARGVPTELRTLVAVPVLLTGENDLREQIERLEVHFLSSVGGAVHYALLSDGPDAATDVTAQDPALIAMAREATEALNRRYPMEDGPRFLFLHRRRQWNPSEGRWMGWERKRGKLDELNRLLRGATETSFVVGQDQVPGNVRLVVTLDADTRLPRDALRRLIGKMAHPMNRPRLDPDEARVVDGHGVLQPRVTPALPVDGEGTPYQLVFSSPGGIEPYAAAVSDVYQDLFGEGSFTGKGIYDVDAFTAALEGRVPDNTMLSHDLFEGTFARAGLASDVEVVEEFPGRMDVALGRQHRWVRGDWQLLPWVLRDRAIPAVGRWKMIDNLRRSLVMPGALVTLGAGWLLPLPQALAWTICVLAMLAAPPLLPVLHAIPPRLRDHDPGTHLRRLGRDAAIAAMQIGLSILFLAVNAMTMIDAIGRTLVRVAITRRHLLEWVPAAQAAARSQPGLGGHVRLMAGALLLGTTVAVLVVTLVPENWPLPVGFAILWATAPFVAWRISQPNAPPRLVSLSPAEVQRLRAIARQTWRFFETFVTEADNHLPPDNMQETPRQAIAHRTSPTNIGLYLLSTVAACDLGWLSRAEAARRLEQTFDRMDQMPRFRGHFFNWYDTTNLRVLDPAYVSSVDSGNLAGHLIAVTHACREWANRPPDEGAHLDGLRDAAHLARAASGQSDRPALEHLIEAIDQGDLAVVGDAAQAAHDESVAASGPESEAAYWTAALLRQLAGHVAPPSADMAARMADLAERAESFAGKMDFAFLLDPDTDLLSIGYSAATNTLDPNCYDLLASEARLASLFAIAKSDVPTRHWFRLGRAATPTSSGAALISWSGSMFEYLMPSLVMREPDGSMLGQSNTRIVARQQAYGQEIGIPWGISESAYNARDLEMTYQYSNFGVPGLGLKRGLNQHRVVAPYATGLATMVDPRGALDNFARLERMGARGRFGFYEAVDFTPERVPEGQEMAIVQSFMAHHQGMTIAAIANCVSGGLLRSRFHAEPMVKAVDLLLQERVPRDISTKRSHAPEAATTTPDPTDVPSLRRFDNPAMARPTGHLLANGRYGVMLTPTGAGFSRWRDFAVTRWRDDATVDALGWFTYLADVDSGERWSAGLQPGGTAQTQHSAVFSEHLATYTCRMRGLTTVTEVVVSAEDDAEARRITLTNAGRQAREIDVTSCMELALAAQSADLAHPAFSKLFVVTDFLPELGALVATRRRRSPDEPAIWAAHFAVVDGTESAPMQHETDRARFIGRGQSLARPMAAERPLSGTTGTVLDPVFAIRRRVVVPPGGRVRITFWTCVADTPEMLLDLVDRQRDPSAFDRAETLAWTQAQVQLRHLGISNSAAADLQTLAGMILRADPELRPRSGRIIAGAGPQSGLWPQGLSGDLPIVVLQVDDIADLPRVRQIIAAHEYWLSRQLSVDLVILNERAASYVQDLQNGIEAAVRAAQISPRATGMRRGTIRVLRTDLVTAEFRARLLSVARVVLDAGRGGLGQQLDRLPIAPPVVVPPRRSVVDAESAPNAPELEFFNGTGGFDADGKEYVIHLAQGSTTPAPWINVIANTSFGFTVSAEGSGAVWSGNSRENLLTPWSNDPVTDPSGEAIYLRDLDSGAIWTPTALPIRGPGAYVARHGFGYSRFDHAAHGIATSLLQMVPLDDPVRISQLTLQNRSDRVRRLAVTAYVEWVMGQSRHVTAPHVTTELCPRTGALLARNPFGMAFPGRVAFADIGEKVDGWTCDRAEVLGPGGTMADPRGLRGQPLSQRAGAALDPCAAQSRVVTLRPGESIDIRLLLGEAQDIEAAQGLILDHRRRELQAMQADIAQHWDNILGAVQVRTPDRAMDILLNGWLMYQTLACRIWARAGFYQASGAYGFRDQLQDGMALTFARPALTREHLLRAAARQYPEGDVQHWWLPHSGQGVRTHISDDRVWLGHAVARYVAITGDEAVLDEPIAFLEGPPVPTGAHDDFQAPLVSDETAPLFEHCARGIDLAIALTGENGLPLIGTGDWNDGMNRVGDGGRGTSVWLGWFLVATIRMLLPVAERRDAARAERWRAHAEEMLAAIETVAWDGAWYRRGTFDDGTWLGSARSPECRIDSIAQSWAVLSEAADPVRAAAGMASLEHLLIRRKPGLALLFTPPFDKWAVDPGYIKGYPPGLRENGGQYSHAAMWAILAFARLGQGDKAADLFAMLNPVNHARTPMDVARYRAEPYVIAADVYSVEPHEGRAGWSWYTGSAAWMYRAGIEGIVGLTRAGETLILDPCIPSDWPGLGVTVRLGDATVEIEIDNRAGAGTGVASATVDGATTPHDGGPFHLELRSGHHAVRLTLGRSDT